MERNKDFKGKPSPLLSVCTGGDTIMLLLKLNQEKENSWDLTAHHPAICHASAAVRSSLVLQTELDRTGQTGQADRGWNFFFFFFLNTAQNMDRIFPLSVSSTPEPCPQFLSPTSFSSWCGPTVREKFKG